ncbi:MAG: hypothetical protein AAB638_04195 [Patescibacteria group bacterium]
MAQDIVFPKFLTVDMAQRAIRHVFNLIMDPKSPLGQEITDEERRSGFHVVINTPALIDSLLGRATLFEQSEGNPRSWPYPFKDIAQCKMKQMLEGRSDGTSVSYHLLFPLDTPYWGGDTKDGLVTTCSGFTQESDHAVSAAINEKLIALAQEAWEASPEKAQGANFVFIR